MSVRASVRASMRVNKFTGEIIKINYARKYCPLQIRGHPKSMGRQTVCQTQQLLFSLCCISDFKDALKSIGRVSLARENEAGGIWGQEVNILHVNV